MRSDLSDLLERGAERPSAEPDFVDLARRGRRRRRTQQATTALAVVAVIALTAGVVMPRLRQPDVVFDSGPRGGVGTWEAVPPSPVGHRDRAMVAADDRRVVVFGGNTDGESGMESFTDGAMYDLESRTWTRIPPPPGDGDADGYGAQLELLPDGRVMLLRSDPITAAFYDVGARRWELTEPAPVKPRALEAAVWTGEQLILWGGWSESGERGDGAVWTPGRGWAVMAASPLSPRSEFAWAWTGDRLLIWGGGSGDAENGERETVFADGAAYDPATDRWSAMATSALQARRWLQGGLWTGTELVVMGGNGPATPVADAGEPTGPTLRDESAAVDCDGGTCYDTGGAEVTFGLQSQPGEDFVDGARYNPSTDTWTSVALPPKGYRAIVYLAHGQYLAFGRQGQAEYDPASDEWSQRPNPGIGEEVRADDPVPLGDDEVLLNSSRWTGPMDTDRPRRLGGVVYQESIGRWDPLAEADTPQRSGAVTAVVGERLFVWGGTSVTEDISQGSDGDPATWRYHDDGAILTID
jgi:hypothetical protein